MGNCCCCCPCDQKDEADNVISRELARDKKIGNDVRKILLLGSGGSGKSTIFKQLRGIYGTGFNALERRLFVSRIHEQVITQMTLALEILEEYREGDVDGLLHQNEIKYITKPISDIKEDIEDDDIEYDDDYNEDNFDSTIPELSEDGQEAAAFLNGLLCTSYKLNDEIVNALKCLWLEPAIQKMYEMRNITKIVDSSAYFWDKLDHLNNPNYVPDEADILLVRFRTTGATEEKYEMTDGKGSFSIIDVGGQKSERKKWIKWFDNVTAVIFVASLSCYDEVLYEDYYTNSMIDQLELFDDICNNEALKETNMILFLNKKDLFRDKIKKAPLTKCLSFADYKGAKDSFEHTTKYIRAAFASLNNSPDRKNIFVHLTCATDQDNIQKVFADVQHIIIEKSLMEAGLMDFDDNQTYKSPDSYDNSFHNPQLALSVRNSIIISNERKQMSYDGMNTISNFRDIIKNNSYPELYNVDYNRILMEYNYDNQLNKNGIQFCDDKNGLLNGKCYWAQSFKVFGKKKTLETFILLDLKPNIDIQQRIARKPVNLCIVLDLRQQMNNYFNDGKRKIDAVKQMIISIIKTKLYGSDRLSIVTFGMDAKIIQEINDISNINKQKLFDIIENIECEKRTLDSETIDSIGYQFGVSQLRKLETENKNMAEYSNRIIIITTRLNQKIMTECGNVSKKGYYSTFIGISNRFSLQRTILGNINGCNYFNINNSQQLNEKIVNRFEEIVTPVLFDLNIILNVKNSGDKCVESIYRLNGEDDNDEINIKGNSNKIFSLKTLFLRKQKYDNIIITDDDIHNVNNRYLLLIKLIPNTCEYELLIEYKTDKGQYKKTSINISLERSNDNTLLNGSDQEYYDNNAIRKAVLLMRYIRILREWINNTQIEEPNYVSDEFKNKFKQFHNYFKNESKFINDDKLLNKEINVLSYLMTSKQRKRKSYTGYDSVGIKHHNINEQSNVNAFNVLKGKKGKKRNKTGDYYVQLQDYTE